MDKTIIYNTVRQEILEQKKCQFQLFAATVTFSSAAFAVGSAKDITLLIFVAPIVLNVVALTMILDKSFSIQRMVGYLQVLESRTKDTRWMWEYHLNIFRSTQTVPRGSEPARKHRYIRNIFRMLYGLNILATILLVWKYRKEKPTLTTVDLIISATTVVIIILGFSNYLYKRHLLIHGSYTSVAIRKHWEDILDQNP